MLRRTTLELESELLDRARKALGQPTIRATVEEALRRATDGAEEEHSRRAALQSAYFDMLGERTDLSVLATEDMWR